jgi:hypothetical protein
MSEMEQLKQEADKQKIIQRYKELDAYIDKLSDDIDRCMKRQHDAWIVYFVAWFSWMIVGFFDKGQNYNFLMIFMFALIYTSYRQAKLSRAFGRFFGAMEVLEIMGFIDKIDRGGKKKRKIVNEFSEMVTGWFKQKKEAQDKVYAPA